MVDLESVDLFYGLADADLDRIRRLLRPQSFPAGATIFSAQQPGNTVYVIADGTVKVFVDQSDGSEVVLAYLGPGDTVGEMSLMDSAGRSANVVTVEETRCWWLDRDAFLECLREIPRLGYNLFGLLTARLRVANEQIQAMSSLDVTSRVARQVLALADKYGRRRGTGSVLVRLRLSQSDLAGMIGASRERVNRAMTSLRRKGLVDVDPQHRIVVRDREGLAAQVGKPAARRVTKVTPGG